MRGAVSALCCWAFADALFAHRASSSMRRHQVVDVLRQRTALSAGGVEDDSADSVLGLRREYGTLSEEAEVRRRANEYQAQLARSDSEQRQLESNAYFQMVAKLSPGEIIGKFAKTAPPKVQDAVRNTIVGILGSAGSFALESVTTTTSERLANLMFQLQMTGYMFKNAEYRMTLSQSLRELPAAEFLDVDADDWPEVSGSVKVSMGGSEVSVDADAYMSELRNEVLGLRKELARVQSERQEAQNADLLAYVRSMPEQQMTSLTSDVTDDVLDAMKKLVYSIMRGMGTSTLDPSLVLQQSGSAMAQLCMWQLVIGYNLRELEVRDQLQNQLSSTESSQ